MSQLIKIREMSLKYGISARALKYYEEMGLISSVRSDDYAYRMYDEVAVKRLEQILILRKLNISIRDIQRIFNTSGSEVVLEVLGKKIDDIDEEVSLLHELKEIVLEFIHQIKQADFGKESDVKRLYEKAKEIEIQIANVDYDGNAANVNRLLEVTEKLDKKVPDVTIVRIPKCRVVSSGYDTFDNLFSENGFSQWINSHLSLIKTIIFDAHDFLWGTGDGKAIWIYAIKDEVTEEDCKPYEIIEFDGGLFASAVGIDGDGESMNNVHKKVFKWLESTNFVFDENRISKGSSMGHMIYPDDEEITKGLGYKQLEMYLPIKLCIK